MIKVGSRVKFLHSTGSGIVRSINGNLANVDVDGFEIPALISDIVEVPIELENAAIVKIGPSDPKPSKNAADGNTQKASVKYGQRYGKVSLDEDYEDDEPVINIDRLKSHYAAQVTQKVLNSQPAQAESVKVEAAPYEDSEYTVKLAFVPSGKGKPETLDLDAYIVNDSSYDMYYCVAIWKRGYVETIKHGRIEADTKEHFRKFPRSSFAQIQTLHISLMPFKPINYIPQIVENFDIELHPLKFIRSGNYTENDYFDEPSFMFSLTGENHEFEHKMTEIAVQPVTPKKEDLKPSHQEKNRSHNEPQIEDLHIESILDSWEGLQPSEVLAAQLSRFSFVIDTALRNKHRGKIVFIHGVGKGKLKYELKKLLDRQYPKLRYQDASFAEYGYGAIMVFV